jgi:hypothetical protein
MSPRLRTVTLPFVFGAGLVAGRFVQDPQPVPAGKPAAASSASASEAKPGAPKPHPFQGVFRLTARCSDGEVALEPGIGHLAITGRHLFLVAGAPSSTPNVLLLRSSVRTLRVKDDTMTTRIVAGWLVDDDRHVVLEDEGKEEPRRVLLVQGGLRIEQDQRNWLEFERVE